MSRGSREKLLAEADMAIRVQHNAVDLVDEAVCERLGINRKDLRCLDVLERNGRMTAGHLAQETGLTTGAITALLDRLEAAGYVSRIRDELDRRKVFVELAPKAQELAHELYYPLADQIHPEFDRLTDDQLIAMRDFHNRCTELMTAYAANVRAEAERLRRDEKSKKTT